MHLYTVCWNEEIILPHFLAHYQFCQRIVVSDNGSTDNSLAILSNDEKVEIRHFVTNDQYQEDALQELRNNAWKDSIGKADFVIVCDCDEFLYHPNLLSVLQKMKRQGSTVMLPKGFQMLGDKAPHSQQNLMQYFPRGSRLQSYDKSILFDPNAIQEINYRVGAHVCDPVGTIKYFCVPGLALLHYRYLSKEYVFKKNQGYRSRACKEDDQRRYNMHHRLTLDQIEQTMAAYMYDSVDIVSVLQKQAMRFGGRWEPIELKQLAAQGLVQLRNNEVSKAGQSFRYVALWHPDWPEVGIGLTAILYTKQKFNSNTVFTLRRTASLLAADQTLEAAYLYMSEVFESLGQEVLAERCQTQALP